MFAQVYLPELLSHTELDSYLEGGWFRMGQTIFTTNFLHFKERLYSAIWLRILLHDLQDDTTQAKLFKKNAVFRHEIKPAVITPEKEALFEKYRASVPFETSTSLTMLLMGKTATQNIYDTYEVNVYDGATLIAVGFFDLGSHSAMGISSIYDPDYKKYSLGKYLIYRKIEYCKALGLRYFYPGYFVPSYSFFDYKLTIGRQTLEYLQLKSGKWKSVDEFAPDDIPIDVMTSKLMAATNVLENAGIDHRFFRYELFDANLIPSLSGAELFDYPVFILCHTGNPDHIGPVLVYDVQDEQYHLLTCFSVWQHPSPNVQSDFYATHLLKVSEYIATGRSLEKMVLAILASSPS
jgi:leucyl-tRNA---protein transferase